MKLFLKTSARNAHSEDFPVILELIWSMEQTNRKWDTVFLLSVQTSCWWSVSSKEMVTIETWVHGTLSCPRTAINITPFKHLFFQVWSGMEKGHDDFLYNIPDN